MISLPMPHLPEREYADRSPSRQELGLVDFNLDFDGHGGAEVVSGADATAQRIGLLLTQGYVRESLPVANLRAPLALIFSTTLSEDYVLDITCNEIQEVFDIVDPTIRVVRRATKVINDQETGQVYLGLVLYDSESNQNIPLVV